MVLKDLISRQLLGYGVKKSAGLVLFVALLVSAGCRSVTPQPRGSTPEPAKMETSSADVKAVALSGKWHTVKVAPRPGQPKIRRLDKLNPVWWFGNVDEPVPPEWYRPNDKHRNAKWRWRNSFHNFNNYVIGVADKPFVRSGRYPERNSNPRGGWDFAVSRRKLLLLPFLSYQRGRFNLYFGWRERGNFGMKLNVSAPPPKPRTGDSARTAGAKSGGSP